MEIDDTHFGLVAELLADGEVVPFLGAGANLCDRPVEARWEPGSFAPSGRELARALAEKSKYPNPDDPALDLLKVSQYYEAVSGAAPAVREAPRGLRHRPHAELTPPARARSGAVASVARSSCSC